MHDDWCTLGSSRSPHTIHPYDRAPVPDTLSGEVSDEVSGEVSEEVSGEVSEEVSGEVCEEVEWRGV